MKSGLVCKPNQSRNQGPTVQAPAFAKDPSAALPIDHLNLCQPAPYHHPLAPPITAPTHSAPIPQIPHLAVPNQDLRNFPSPLRRSPSLQPRGIIFLVTGFHCQRKQEEGLEKKGDFRIKEKETQEQRDKRKGFWKKTEEGDDQGGRENFQRAFRK